MPNRDPELYLDDIRESCEKILLYVTGVDREAFEKNPMMIDAVVRNIGIIGEAVSQLPNEVCDRFPDVDWYEIKGMRNIVVHEYFGIRMDILWKTIKEDIPALKNLIDEQTT